MTSHLETAIRDAVEGGYSWKGMTSGALLGYLFALPTTTAPAILLDPDFWRCLGKSRGWGVEMCSNCQYEIEGHVKTRIGKVWCSAAHISRPWAHKWMDFTRHLIAGKDIESFFATISTNN